MYFAGYLITVSIFQERFNAYSWRVRRILRLCRCKIPPILGTYTCKSIPVINLVILLQSLNGFIMLNWNSCKYVKCGPIQFMIHGKSSPYFMYGKHLLIAIFRTSSPTHNYQSMFWMQCQLVVQIEKKGFGITYLHKMQWLTKVTTQSKSHYGLVKLFDWFSPHNFSLLLIDQVI